MIRKALLAMVVVASAMGALPQAHALAPLVKTGVFAGPASGGAVPCGPACSYWIDDPICNAGVQEACQGGVMRSGYSECKDPGPGYSHLPDRPDGTRDQIPEPVRSNQPRSYQDVKIKAPAGYNYVVFKIFPNVDWDSFVCIGTATSNNGKLRQSGAHAVLEPCDGVTGPDDPTGTGCAETIAMESKPGTWYVFRAYNWGDLTDCPYTITFKQVL